MDSPKEQSIFIDPEDVFSKDVTWTTVPFGAYKSEYVPAAK